LRKHRIKKDIHQFGRLSEGTRTERVEVRRKLWMGDTNLRGIHIEILSATMNISSHSS
jgi:hypothetical protein